MIWVICLVSVVELQEKEMYVSMLVGLTESKGRKGFGMHACRQGGCILQLQAEEEED